MIPTNKELRKLYPIAKSGHKKNCTCFVCELARGELWAIDNPELARVENEKFRKKMKDQQELIDACKKNAKTAKANRNKAITGNPYYKLDRDSIHCAECGQRLGGLSYSCPLCKCHKFVYGQMLNNPADRRWDDPIYNKSPLNTRYQTEMGEVVEKSVAESSLEERMKEFKNPEDLV